MGLTNAPENIQISDCYTNGVVTNWGCNYFNEVAVIVLLVIFVGCLVSVCICLAYCSYFKIQAKRQKDDYR
ncbi:hypothetical protein BOX15_Mlig031375g1 [Macrostomum lignano]|uniref:Uncharacterized protein n=1 Tax=Macrostomum lignano TaxID=282301 RepID=A0A267F9I7_9PLAT|nr:hypothetical protein BOX15_Mlig016070g2 [Macrostomum lignano]PAA72247.1 hypothetical protein BOX15_Mlig016070g1 [Macrostomum lignano]PAA93273.1 hypothetical protein BOX15_Mlig031375g1 [Macrostomum lignano]